MPTYPNEEFIRIMRPLPRFVERDVHSIPFVEPDYIDITALENGLSLISMHNAKASDVRAKTRIVHCFRNDDELDREYNRPIKYLARVAGYYAVATFDFSMDAAMDDQTLIQQTYKNRWSGAFLQANGLSTICTVGWVPSRKYEITFAGLRDGGTLMISSLSIKNKMGLPAFLHGYHALRERFPHSQIICVGNRFPGLTSDVCLIPYDHTFGSGKSPFWQPSMLNWDMSIAEGGAV